MNVETAIAKFEQLVGEHGQLPKSVRLTKYRSFEDWHLPAEDGPATPADFRAAEKATDEFAEYLTRRGVRVEGVKFNRRSYDFWRRRRADPDSRNLRAQWANEKDRKISLAFIIEHNSIGWAVIGE